MKRIHKITCGIALLALGIGWALEIAGVITISLDGWWTLFVIIPCFVAIFGSHDKTIPLTGLGIGILLLLATRNIITWNDFWKYAICFIAVLWGLKLIFSRKHTFGTRAERQTIDELEKIDQNGRQIRQINVSFGKQIFEFSGYRFEGADVKNSFGFTELNLRGADIVDGSVINVDCSFGGIEIRVDNNICVKNAVEATFAGVECYRSVTPGDNVKTLYIKGECSFGGIEIK